MGRCLAGGTGADDHEIERFHGAQCRASCRACTAPRCRTVSYRRIAAATDTFRLSARPAIGIVTEVTDGSRQVPDRPSASAPRTTASGPFRSAFVYEIAASTI